MLPCPVASRRVRLSVLGLLAAVIASQSAQPAGATPPPAASASVRVQDRENVQLLDAAGGLLGTLKIPTAHAVRDVLRTGSVLYVACGPDGVLTFDLADPAGPRLVGRFGAGRNAVRLALAGSQLLVIVAEYGTLAYSLHDPQHPSATALDASGEAAPGTLPSVAQPTEASAATTAQVAPSTAAALAPGARPAPSTAATAATAARVTKVSMGWVAISSTEPIAIGDRFVLRSQRLVRTVDPTTGRSERQPSNEALGAFAVERTYPSVTEAGRTIYAASGRLLRGTVVRVGDMAQPTQEALREPLYVPHLWYGMFRFSGHLRPMFGVSPLTYGMLNDFRFEYYLPVPIKVGVSVAPLGFLSSNPVGVISEVRASLAFSSSYFELSLDPGGILNRLGGTAFSFGFSFRLGSLDGLNLIFRSGYRLLQTGGREPDFGFFSAGGEINIPLAKRFTLQLAGDGAQPYIWGTLGLKYWLRGNGGPGTLILDSGVGGAYIDDSCRAIDLYNNTCTSLLTGAGSARGAGPVASLGLDARF